METKSTAKSGGSPKRIGRRCLEGGLPALAIVVCWGGMPVGVCWGAARVGGQPAGHSGTKIHSGWAEDDDDAGGHVFAAVMADAFDDSERAAIADGEAFADAAGDEKFSAGGAVEHGVASEHVAALRSRSSSGDGDGASAETFADVIVGVTEKFEAQAGDEECADTLSGGAAEF